MSTTTLLHCLRAASLRRWVMACVLMAWGCAWAAPLLQPAGLHVVCGANGHVKVVASAPMGGTGAIDAIDAHDCPLCTPPSVLPPSVPASPRPSAVTACAAAAPVPSPATAAPGDLPPARGPPLH